MTGWERTLLERLEEIQRRGLLRSLRRTTPLQGAHVLCDGRQVLNFSSNDYLGLAGHPALRDAARDALSGGPGGAGASRLVCGNYPMHEQLEETIASFKKSESALSFSSGYAAALGTIPALVGASDIIIMDKLCHASLVDGARLSGAMIRVFPHNDLSVLERHLRWAREKHAGAHILVLAESVYSMDGDLAPLREIVELKERFGSWLFLDEAHGVGVFGDHGRGVADRAGCQDRIEVQMGTLGKALGTAGAYVCGSKALRDYLINRARSFVFSTAPPPHCAAAACAALGILLSPEGETLIRKLHRNVQLFRTCDDRESPIVPWMIGAEECAMKASSFLLEEGFLAPAIRYPTVAKGAARLRITLSALHSHEEIQNLASAVRRATDYLGRAGTPPAAPVADSSKVPPVETAG